MDEEQKMLQADELILTPEEEAALDRAWATITQEDIDKSVRELEEDDSTK